MIELDMAKNMFGYIDIGIKKRIFEFFENPNFDTWNDIAGIIIFWGKGQTSTIWQFVLEIDPTFCRKGRSTNLKGKMIDEWEKIPSIETVKKAIIFATH